MSILSDKIEHLIREYFHTVNATTDPVQRRKFVELWLNRQVEPCRVVGLYLISNILPVLRNVERTTIERDGPRHVFRVDSANLVKSPASILAKMAREWKDESLPPPIDFSNFHTLLSDLARFRIVANFLSDASEIVTALNHAFSDSSTGPIHPQGMILVSRFDLVEDGFRDSVFVRPRDRHSGERCWKATFRPKPPAEARLIEVQVLSQLAEAWDKKEHFLSYEIRRRGEEIPMEEDCELRAMSELLFIADQSFDRIRSRLRPSAASEEAR